MQLSREKLLVDIYCAYRDARKHKRNNNTQLRFEKNLEENLVTLRDEMFEKRYRPSRAKCFIVNGPVKREIFSSSFRDRVVYHLIFNYVSPFFDRRLIYDSYSCRIGKGTSAGTSRYRHHIRSCSHNYSKDAFILKMDVKGYFMHIHKDILLKIVFSTLDSKASQLCSQGNSWSNVMDLDYVKYLLSVIIQWNPVADCIYGSPRRLWDGLPESKRLTCAPEGYGLPIGDLTSQLFSNIYMDVFDEWVKRELKIKHYGRYVDDFYIVHENREYLLSLIPKITAFLKDNLDLDINPKKTILQSATRGINFLGAYILPYCVFPSRRVIYEFKSFVSNMESKCNSSEFSVTDAERLIPSINSRFGYIAKFSSKRLLFSSLAKAPHFRSLYSFDMDMASCCVKSLMKKPRVFPSYINYLYYSEYRRYLGTRNRRVES